MSVDNRVERPLTALELLSRVHILPPGGGMKVEPRATDLSKVVPKPSQSGNVAFSMSEQEKHTAKKEAKRPALLKKADISDIIECE